MAVSFIIIIICTKWLREEKSFNYFFTQYQNFLKQKLGIKYWLFKYLKGLLMEKAIEGYNERLEEIDDNSYN